MKQIVFTYKIRNCEECCYFSKVDTCEHPNSLKDKTVYGNKVKVGRDIRHDPSKRVARWCPLEDAE